MPEYVGLGVPIKQSSKMQNEIKGLLVMIHLNPRILAYLHVFIYQNIYQ